MMIFQHCKPEKKTQRLETSTTSKPEKSSSISEQPKETPEGMVWIPAGTFYQGAVNHDRMAMSHEKPRHHVEMEGFFMDMHPVTNKQFREFVETTNYVTVAEQGIDWEEMKKQVPPGTPKPHDSILQPGSLVFIKTTTSVPNLYDYSQWWKWKIGANWKHPNGPESSIKGKDDHPVVQIAYEDALAYCKWAGKRLPTEAEWEYAARGGKEDTIFFWGNESDQLHEYANTWEGEFPVDNTQEDGYEHRAPVMTFPKNGFGLHGMAGNVWQWTSDWYDINYYSTLEKRGVSKNPKGPNITNNPSNPYASEKVIKGGSFLCSASYCASYRISARMATSLDSGLEHLGFRTVMEVSQ
jgi:formylglycine-generating enzyme required for sulfatase activity